jgi:Kef-type K+ transport system membrane component KefB
MQSLSESQLLFGLLAIAIILVVGRGTAEIARRLGQPEVLGELLGGFLLGPSVLGALLPGVRQAIFLGGPVSLGLSLFSWVGAILLLLIAGFEVDLAILRQELRPGVLAAVGAIVPSLAAGTLFAVWVLNRALPGGSMLGIVLSVTAVGVAAKILIERDALRRRYAQVILAAGIASEVLVWLFIAVVSSIRGGSPVLAGVRSTVFAVLFFLVMLTLGRRFTFWAMRRTADMTAIVNGQLSLLLVLGFLSAAFTEWLGLHALLGAFVFGVIVSQSPRATLPLKESLQALTVGVFAPIFFVLAGMRVDIFQLGSHTAVGIVVLLFVVASSVKVGFVALGVRLGGLSTWESLLVGVGVNLKGGTDVIVAILGVELGLLTVRSYTLYAVVAILTVMATPPVIALLERRVRPSRGEVARLEREEARRRAYMPRIERVLVPVMPQLQSLSAARLVETIAKAKTAEHETFDITQLVIEDEVQPSRRVSAAMSRAEDALESAAALHEVELTEQTLRADLEGAVQRILEASTDYGLIALGAASPGSSPVLSLGGLQDRIIDSANADVLVVVGPAQGIAGEIERILVPVNGFEYSMAAGDVAAYLAKATGAELVLFNVVHAKLDSIFWKERERRRVLETGYQIVRELEFRMSRLDVRTSARVELGNDPAEAILNELERQPYQLVVLGAADRSGDNRLYLGSPTQTILTQTRVPVVLLVSHEVAGQTGAA